MSKVMKIVKDYEDKKLSQDVGTYNIMSQIIQYINTIQFFSYNSELVQ